MGVLQAHANALIKADYREAREKPNLFYFKTENATFFADMRGTQMVKIWEDPVPLVYATFVEHFAHWRKRRLIKEELRRLESIGCRWRVSFYEECEPGGLFFEDEDGFCKECGSDFQGPGLYCSSSCEAQAERRQLIEGISNLQTCEVCKRRIAPDRSFRSKAKEIAGVDLAYRSIEHHVSYPTEMTIVVCVDCHNKIHHTKDPKFESLRPANRRPQRIPKTSICPSCNKKRMSKDRNSCRECEARELLNAGKAPVEIAREMGISISTARKYLRAVRRSEKEAGGADTVVCKKCGKVFNGTNRTTCPECREFFR
jgi:hypothetical protein